jgi:nucleotide-binding universal stress UspA family protein
MLPKFKVDALLTREVDMLSIRTVLCSVDFSAATARQVDLAIEMCQAFGAQLILHHNHAEMAIGSGVGWMWAPGHGQFAVTAEQKMRDLVARVPAGTPVEMSLTHGSIAEAVLSVGYAVEADLVVMSTRASTSPGDGSVTDRVLEAASLPIFAMHDAEHDHRTPRFTATERQPLLVPTDLTPASQPAVDVAFDLARRFAFDVHLLHVLPHGAKDGEAAAHARRMMSALAPPDLPRPLEEHIETGVPARAIAYAAQQISAACIVMGEHARTPMRHWFRPDTSHGVLHPAPCPIWYVPQPAATAAARLKFARAQAGHSTALQASRASNAARRLVDELQDPSFNYWPSFYLYGVVDSTEAAELALFDLLAAGVKEDQLHTWHGPAGVAAIDPTGQKHGPMARLWRALETVTGERDLLENYASEVERGHVRIGVQVRSGEKRQLLTEILQKHGGHLISYFSVGSVERLSP